MEELVITFYKNVLRNVSNLSLIVAVVALLLLRSKLGQRKRFEEEIKAKQAPPTHPEEEARVEGTAAQQFCEK